MKLFQSALMMISVLQLSMTTVRAEEIALENLPDMDAVEIETVVEGQKIEPVQGDRLRLLGSGLKNRDSQENLALACANETCEKLRFIYFKSPTEAYFIGDSLRMPQADSPKLQKKALKLVIQNYFDTHNTDGSGAKLEKHGFVSFLILGGAVTAAVFTLGASVAIIGGMGGGYFLLTSHGVIDYMTTGAIVDASLTATQGWNWSSDMKKISDKAFRGFLNQIINGTTEWNSNTASRLRNHDAKWRRLSDQGVRF